VQKDRDILKVVGINSRGYGTIPKLVMQDKRLTIESKAIYAYFSSYAGAGSNAFPGLSKILYDLGISESRYYRHFKLLTAIGYITVEQIKDNGRFGHNVYIQNTEISPIPQNDGTAPIPQNGCAENERTQNKGTNINNSKTNSINKKINNKKERVTKKTDKKDKYEKFYL